MCMCLFVNITMFDLYSVICFSCFYWEPFENPQGKSIFIVCACTIEVLLACTCVFATKTMAVLSTKMANFGGIFSAIVRLFRLGGGATDSDNVSFYLLIHVKILFHEGCNRIYFLSIFSMLISQPKRKLCSATLTKRLDSNDLYIIYLEKKS